jgi:DNA (cytosine-5)-methyltransferase 1
MLTGVSLFAGIGGFDLAMQRTGIDVKAAVEIDAKCRQVLGRRFPESSLFGDIQEVTGADLRASGFAGASGVITGGFPCQDLSVAGRRAGLEGARSGLFWEIVRLLDETQSKWFVLENVPGLLNSQRGRDMGIVVGTLAELGYGLGWRVLDAQHFGVPQRRRRVFIVGCLGDPSGGSEVLFEHEGSVRDLEAGQQERQVAATGPRGSIASVYVKRKRAQTSEDYESWSEGEVSPTLNVMDNSAESYATVLAFDSTFGGQSNVFREQTPPLKVGSSVGIPSPPAASTQEGVRRLTPRECERLQGFPDDWTSGQSDSARYRQLGNAVAVPVVEWILRRIVEVDRERA